MATRILHIYIPKQFAVLVSIMIFLAIVVSVIVTCVPTRIARFSYNGPEPPVCAVTMTSSDGAYEVAALEGQIEVIFNQDVSHKQAIKIFKEYKVKILAQFPESHYYMIEVPAGKESEYISQLNRLPEIKYVQPNVLYTLCSASPFVIDNFCDDHGEMVTEMFKESGNLKHLGTIDVHREGSKKYMPSDKINASIMEILENQRNNESVVINLSIGLRLAGTSDLLYKNPEEDNTRILWNDWDVGSVDRRSFINGTKQSLISLIILTLPYNDNDFVIVKAAGNVGMKNMESIIEDVRLSLSNYGREFFDKHFILVSAKDDNKEGDYPNDVSYYTPMVTKVDISDKTAKDLHWQGTSFASPRVAGFIARAVNEYDMKAVDVMQCVRAATRRAYDHLISYPLLTAEIEIWQRRKWEEENHIYGAYNIIEDLVGKTIDFPSDGEFFRSPGKWCLRWEDIVDVSVLNTNENNGIVEINAIVHLSDGALRVDAEMVLRYLKKGNGLALQSWFVNKMSIPQQEDYSQCVELQKECGFSYYLMAYNHCDYTLFYVADYVLSGKHYYHVGILKPNSSDPVIAMGDAESFSVRFAYRM